MSATIFISSSYLRYSCNTPFAENRQIYVWLVQQNQAGKETKCIFQIHNFYSNIYSCKILAVSEMNSNAIQTKTRFLNPIKVLDVHAKWGICYPFQELHVHRYPKEQKEEYQKRLQNWQCRAEHSPCFFYTFCELCKYDILYCFVLSLRVSIWKYCLCFNLELVLLNRIWYIFQECLAENKAIIWTEISVFFLIASSIIKVPACQF